MTLHQADVSVARDRISDCTAALLPCHADARVTEQQY